MQLFCLSGTGRLGHTQIDHTADQQCVLESADNVLMYTARKLVDVVFAESDRPLRLPQQMRPRRWRGRMLWPGLPSGQRTLDPA